MTARAMSNSAPTTAIPAINPVLLLDGDGTGLDEADAEAVDIAAPPLARLLEKSEVDDAVDGEDGEDASLCERDELEPAGPTTAEVVAGVGPGVVSPGELLGNEDVTIDIGLFIGSKLQVSGTPFRYVTGVGEPIAPAAGNAITYVPLSVVGCGVPPAGG